MNMRSSGGGGGGQGERRSPRRLAGVRDPRGPRAPRSPLDDPRKPANRDWLAVARRRLWRQAPSHAFQSGDPDTMRDELKAVYPYFGDWSGELPVLDDLKPVFVGGGATAQISQRPPEPPPAKLNAADSDEELSSLVYRYTKQVDLVNDEMGYGEKIVEPYYRNASDGSPRLERAVRVSQRTKTGRQQLYILEELTKPADEAPTPKAKS